MLTKPTKPKTADVSLPFLSQNWKFTAPVYIGDTITAEAEVIGVHASKPVTQLRFRVIRQTGETVLEGEAWCYTLTTR